jgi:HPr kinase/phosphorylase
MRRDEAGLLADGSVSGVGPLSYDTQRQWLHATCVALKDNGVLLLGASGRGKSDLALRLIDGGGVLVADDQVAIERCDDVVVARPAVTLRGLIEVRGVGILRLPHRSSCPVRLVVDLDTVGPWPRLPEPSRHRLLGIDLARLHLDPRPASACAKVRLALAAERVA